MRVFSLRVTACLMAAFLLGSCRKNTVAGVEVDASLKGYILPKSQILAGINIDAIKETAFYKRHASQLAFPELNQLPDEIGMDPRRDLSSVLTAWDGAAALLIAKGNYKREDVEARLKANSVHSEGYRKLTLYGDGKRDIVFLPKGVALAGPVIPLKRALDQDATGGGVVPEDLQLQLARVNSGAQAWLVSSGVISLEQLSMRSDAATTLSNISDFISGTAIGLKLDSGFALDAHLSCISEEGSQRVNDALRGVIGLARLSTKDDQLDQLQIWDSIHVERQGKEVHVSAVLPQNLADKLVATLPALSKRF